MLWLDQRLLNWTYPHLVSTLNYTRICQVTHENFHFSNDSYNFYRFRQLLKIVNAGLLKNNCNNLLEHPR